MPSQRTLAKLRPILWPVALFYLGLSWWRNVFYRVGFFISRRVSVPVVSIGNLAMGGSGKTPATLFTAEHLLNLGYKVAIVSRGYGRQTAGGVLVSDGEQILATPAEAGDEPFLMANRLAGVPVLVDEDRHLGAASLIRRFSPDVLILDDGFQHRGLARDCDIVLLDAGAPQSDYRIFPMGTLREGLTALGRANLVVWTRTNFFPAPQALKERIESIGIPQIESDMEVCPQLVEVKTGAKMDHEKLQGEPLLAFCGIARPHPFYGALMSLGLEPELVRYYSDHHQYAASDLATLSELAGGDRMVMVTTEKDGVKLDAEFLAGHRVYAVRIEFRLTGSALETFGATLARHLSLPHATTAAGEA